MTVGKTYEWLYYGPNTLAGSALASLPGIDFRLVSGTAVGNNGPGLADCIVIKDPAVTGLNKTAISSAVFGVRLLR